jgi:BirA family biotin operon repressor/biotin-[acetyl-CoA-carboxylase] ligase
VTGIARLEVFESIDSTNAHLLAIEPVPVGQAAVCIAAAQSAGRGRRGRQWVSPAGGGVYLSIGWTFASLRDDLSTLSLAMGVAVKRALDRVGGCGIQLKWPNDIVVDGGKLGGVLIEMRTVPEGAYVVIGVGINLKLPDSLETTVMALGGQAPRDLTAAGVTQPDFLATSLAVITSMCDALPRFAKDGFSAFRDDWRDADSLFGYAVEWGKGEERFSGVARGIEADGALLVEHQGRIEKLVSGDVTLRRAA